MYIVNNLWFLKVLL